MASVLLPQESPESGALKELLWKAYRHAPHAEECRFRRTYPTGREADLCDCFRADLARWLRVRESRSS